jgi:hypothetical protein
LKKKKKAKNITVLSGPMAAFGAGFSLPDNADAEKVNAEFNDGVLKLHIAKREAARPKQIEVKILEIVSSRGEVAHLFRLWIPLLDVIGNVGISFLPSLKISPPIALL